MRAMGDNLGQNFVPAALASDLRISTMADAPSLMELAFAAVTVPSLMPGASRALFLLGRFVGLILVNHHLALPGGDRDRRNLPVELAAILSGFARRIDSSA